jgi:membrane fusion protein
MLFRSEIVQARQERMLGDVNLVIPVAWHVIGYLLATAIAAAIVFLSLAHYARVEVVGGEIAPEQGVSAIVPVRTGIVSRLAVHDGDMVAAGAELATIRSEEDGVGGLPAAAMVEAALGQQDSRLAAQIASTTVSFASQREQAMAQRASLAGEVTQLRSQIEFQNDLINSAAKEAERIRAVADQGFISKHDLQMREDTLAARRQTLAQLTQSLTAKEGQLRVSERQDLQIAAQERAQIQALESSRAQVAQQLASEAGSRVYALRAPIAGRVTALVVRAGQSVRPTDAVMSIVPTRSVLRAALLLPTAAIGFVKPGQEVHLAIDAFPYQRFGTVSGTVKTVASSPVVRQNANGAAVSVYPVSVAIDRPYLDAYGQRQQLIAGMSLSARIITERQSLLQWLFDPVFAVRRRIG